MIIIIDFYIPVSYAVACDTGKCEKMKLFKMKLFKLSNFNLLIFYYQPTINNRAKIEKPMAMAAI